MTEKLWFRRFSLEGPVGRRLVCFPHAGGAATYFAPVARALVPDIDVLAVQYPGRQDRWGEPCIDDIGTLADRIHAMMTAWGPQPLTLFGHSMGAILAYEVARRLRAEHPDQQLHVFASGRRAPHRLRSETVHTRDDAGIIAEMRALGGTDAALLSNPEVLAMILPALRSDYQAIETYRWVPGGPPPCPITVLTGDRDPRTTIEEARDWERHSREPFDVRIFPGGHFYLAEQAPAVLQVIKTHFTSAVR
ncbi:thioesterase II family protein [Actinoplanes couchii]|uniref:Oleoyl-ACP hydrolase n=1 Tax=Actinoplanes couchii TaxID=403638 RepID=A0ABQ3XDM5_9ACTN|nr:alpha/beta fold hydrolase [Actinoplanes couchii]MDR6317090.1 surfactin synthase thioesterase subunit [Actinoplanes couchii]GID56584.1 oleoyl-ACP hydrolase [Actinoplanes couchii]